MHQDITCVQYAKTKDTRPGFPLSKIRQSQRQKVETTQKTHFFYITTSDWATLGSSLREKVATKLSNNKQEQQIIFTSLFVFFEQENRYPTLFRSLFWCGKRISIGHYRVYKSIQSCEKKKHRAKNQIANLIDKISIPP